MLSYASSVNRRGLRYGTPLEMMSHACLLYTSRNLYEQCLKLTQFAAMEFEEIFQFSQGNLKQALETELIDRKSTRLNSSHSDRSRMPSSA